MTSNPLSLRWIPVTDGSGRTRMEAAWTEASDVPTGPASTQAA